MLATAVPMQPTVLSVGRSGRLWDVWRSVDAVDTADGWIGLIEENDSGFTAHDPGRRTFGPYPVRDTAALELARRADQHS